MNPFPWVDILRWLPARFLSHHPVLFGPGARQLLVLQTGTRLREEQKATRVHRVSSSSRYVSVDRLAVFKRKAKEYRRGFTHSTSDTGSIEPLRQARSSLYGAPWPNRLDSRTVIQRPSRDAWSRSTRSKAQPCLEASDTPSQRINLRFAVSRGEDHFAQFAVRTCSMNVVGHPRGDMTSEEGPCER